MTFLPSVITKNLWWGGWNHVKLTSYLSFNNSFHMYWYFLLEWIITAVTARWWFSNPIILLFVLFGILLWGKGFSPYDYVVICLCEHILKDFYFNGSLYYTVSFSCSVCPRFGQWEPLYAGFCVLWTCLYNSLSLRHFWPSPGTSHIFKEHWLLGHGEQYLEMKVWRGGCGTWL